MKINKMEIKKMRNLTVGIYKPSRNYWHIKFLDYCENFEKRLSPENKLLLEVSD